MSLEGKTKLVVVDGGNLAESSRLLGIPIYDLKEMLDDAASKDEPLLFVTNV